MLFRSNIDKGCSQVWQDLLNLWPQVLAGSGVRRSDGQLGARGGPELRPVDLTRSHAAEAGLQPEPSLGPGGRFRVEVIPHNAGRGRCHANPTAPTPRKQTRPPSILIPKASPAPGAHRAAPGAGGPEAPRGPRARSREGRGDQEDRASSFHRHCPPAHPLKSRLS